MKASFLKRAAVLAVVAALGAIGLASCSGEGTSTGSDGVSGGVAATVNGVEIAEQTVTDYVQNFRASQDMTDDESWGNWMADYGLTPASVRETVIDYYVGNELKKQAAEEHAITVDSAEIEDQVSMMRSYYSSDDAWTAALAEAGTTEEQYRESVEIAILETKLREAVEEEEATEPTDDDVLTMMKTYVSAYNNSRRSSHILFDADDKDTAQQVLDQINAGEIDFADAAREYSKDTGSAENGGDVGWDSLNTFVTEYADALKELEPGEVSDLVESTYGWHIIKCTDKFVEPDELTSLDQVPAELVDYVRSIAASSASSTAYSEWYDAYKENADIVINDMPEGLPYDLDMSQYSGSDHDDDEGDDVSWTDDDGTEYVTHSDGSTTVTNPDGTAVTYDYEGNATDEDGNPIEREEPEADPEVEAAAAAGTTEPTDDEEADE